MSWVWMLLAGVSGWLILNVLFVGWLWYHSRPDAVIRRVRPYTDPWRPW